MANLEKNIEEKLTEVFKGEFEKEDFELNYLITDDVITFFLYPTTLFFSIYVFHPLFIIS